MPAPPVSGVHFRPRCAPSNTLPGDVVKLSRQQRLCLDALTSGAWCSADNLARMLNTSTQGAAQTAASLVRNDYAARTIHGGHVRWIITPAGRDIAHLLAQRSPTGGTK